MEVSARIEELKAAVSERQVEETPLTRARVDIMMQENYNRAMQVEPVRDRHGNPTGQFRYDARTAMKVIELAGKALGMFPRTCEPPGSVRVALATARLNRARDRVAAEKKKALEQGLPWPPPSKAAIAEAKKQLQQDGWEPATKSSNKD
jgi:hypothetical protein